MRQPESGSAMIKLVPMGQGAFTSFVEHAMASYAEDNVLAGRWPASEALDRSRDEFQKLLPDGLATTDHFVFEIQLYDCGITVGVIWLAIIPKGASRIGYIYQLQIRQDYRRRGFARQALKAAEEFCAAQGVTTLGLHVFEHNKGARALYDSLGYSVTSYNMTKALSNLGA